MEGDRLFGLLHCETTIIFRIIEEQSVFLIIKQIFSIIKTEFNLCRIDVIAFIVSFVLKGDLQLRFSISRHHPCVFAIQLLIKTILDDGLECPLGIVVSPGRRLDSTRFPVLHVEHVSLLRDVVSTLRLALNTENQ